MLTHEQIWQAIDRLASSFGYSPSGLAKQAGLDPTSFNKSKRFAAAGKPRWPSTESISRVLAATGATMSDFIALVENADEANCPNIAIPIIDWQQAGADNFFNADGSPKGYHWQEIQFPAFNLESEEAVCALEITGHSMAPLYRDRDVLIIAPLSNVRVGDRVVIKTNNGDVMVNELAKQSATHLELKSLSLSHDDSHLAVDDVAWMARILWASQ